MSFLNRFMDDKPRDTTLQSVVRNLSYVLSGRRGYAWRVAAYGLGEYSVELNSHNVAQRLMREILDNIAMNEPRLIVKDIRTLGTDEGLNLYLAVRGSLDGQPCFLQLAFELPTGAISITDARQEPLKKGGR